MGAKIIKKPRNKVNTIIILLSIAMYTISLALPAYCVDGNCGKTWGGGMNVVMGAIGFYVCKACWSWLANPLLYLSWFTFTWSSKFSIVVNVLSFIMAIRFLAADKIIINEGGGTAPITGVEIGYWVWVLSILILLIGNSLNITKIILKYFKEKQPV